MYLKHKSILPKQVVFIGDSVHDYEVAQAVGAECILIADGHEHEERLKKTNATVIDRMKDIFRLID